MSNIGIRSAHIGDTVFFIKRVSGVFGVVRGTVDYVYPVAKHICVDAKPDQYEIGVDAFHEETIANSQAKEINIGQIALLERQLKACEQMVRLLS